MKRAGKTPMKLIVWLKGNRGLACFEALLKAGKNVAAVVMAPEDEKNKRALIASWKRKLGGGVPFLFPADPNAPAFVKKLALLRPDVFVLAGYGKILKPDVLSVPAKLSLNLHGGKVPQYRGSSPLNWALIRGEKSFSLSILQVDAGVDSGPVLAERTFRIGPQDTIADLHKTADSQFPAMLLGVLGQVETGSLRPRKQTGRSGYFPLRFPEDGLILWDLMAASEIHNRIRALRTPYPCAYTYSDGQKIKLVRSEVPGKDFYGEPGRVYRSVGSAFLVGARDKCLWIREAVAETGRPVKIGRYARLATAAEAVTGLQEFLAKKEKR